MEDILNSAEQIIKKQIENNRISFGVRFTKYNKVYAWTNENIQAYLKLVNFTDKSRALSVMASGDQTFNLICHGINTVDTFDVNALTEPYVLGLKRAMVLKYNYFEFLEIVRKIHDVENYEEINDIIKDLLPYMDEKYRLYWSYLIDLNTKIQKEHGTNLNLLHMLTVNYNVFKTHVIFNDYLQNEENYNLLRSRIGQANISFKVGNAFSLHNEFTSSYDFILLSNILDYATSYWGQNWHYHNLKKYTNLLEERLNADGILFLHYLFSYPLSFDEEVFDGSFVKVTDLTDEEMYPFYTGNMDGMILKRKK